jgi:hypothetical protein
MAYGTSLDTSLKRALAEFYSLVCADEEQGG